MKDGIWAELKLEEQAALLRELVDAKCGIAVLDETGRPMMTTDEPPDLEVLRELASLDPDAEVRESNLVRRPLGERGTLLVSALRRPGRTAVGTLVAWLEQAPSDLERLARALPRVAGSIADSHRLRLELTELVDELGDRYEELNLVFSLAERARSLDDPFVGLKALLASFTEHLSVAVAMFVDPHGVPVYTASGAREIPNLDLVLVEMKAKLGRFARAAKRPLVINDRHDPRRHFLLTDLPFKVLAHPGIACRSVDAVLMLLRHIDEPDFTNSELNLAKVFMEQAMIMLQNHQLMERMRRFNRQMAASLVETVEAKDPYTRGHSERVESITDRVARDVGMMDREREDLLWGALLHDIGKIAIPDVILTKPGRLTEDEYVFVKIHPERSYEILRHIEELGQTALLGARYHQEKFDGTGYPFGLQGSEIPLGARVIAVGDTYDAITSSRSYRNALSHDEAIRRIREAAGTQLDPEIVRVFLELVENDDGWLQWIRTQHDPHA